MRAMVFDGSASSAASDRQLPDPMPGCRPDSDRYSRVRRVPHRSASRRWRTAHPKLPLDSGARNRRYVAELGAGVTGFESAIAWVCRGSARRAGIAAFACAGAKISATTGLHRLYDRRRLCGMHRRRRRYCFHLPAQYSRHRGGAAPVRGPDRLSHAQHGGRSRSASASTASARRRISSRRSRVIRGARSMRSRVPAIDAAQQFALRLGAAWAGNSDEAPPDELDAAFIFAPVGALVPLRCARSRRAGVVVCGGIHMSDIPSFPYAFLWGERAWCRSRI